MQSANEPTSERPDEESPAEVDPTPTPESEPSSEPGGECAADADCELYIPCCGCPVSPVVLTRTEADAERERCTRIRCAACALPPDDTTGLSARCLDGTCVMRRDPEEGEARCGADTDCAMHVPCCACPAIPRAAHRQTIATAQQNCASRSCRACDTDIALAPTEARCLEGACVERALGDAH